MSLFDQEYRRREEARARSNDAGLKHCGNLSLNFLFLAKRISIRFNVYRSGGRVEVNAVVGGPRWG